MTNLFQLKPKRSFIPIAFLLGLLIVIFTFAQIFTYFNTGARIQDIMHLTPNLDPEHTPSFDKVITANIIGRPMENHSLEKIKSDYSNAWYLLNRAQNQEVSPSTEYYFFKKPFTKLKTIAAWNNNKDIFIERADLSHNLYFNLYSIDGQVVSMVDSNVLIKERVLTADRKKILVNQTLNMSYDVTFVLNDGNWRIRHLVPYQIHDSIQNINNALTNDNSFVRCIGKQFTVNDTSFVPVGVNYYPAKNTWLDMWNNFDSQQIAKDMKLIRAAGANTVRVFIPYHLFGKGNVKKEELEKLDTLLYNIKINNLFVVVTLFDFIHDYSLENWSKSDRQLETILLRYKNNKEILAWDLKNEPDLDYRDHGKEIVDDWLDFIIKKARNYDPNHLITLGWSNPQDAVLFSERLDFISFHYYLEPKFLGEKMKNLQNNIGEKPLILEEFGQSTYNSIFYTESKDQNDQYDYILQVRKILKSQNNVGYLIWCFYDFDEIPTYVVGKGFYARKVQEHFGIMSKNGKSKPSAKLLPVNAELKEINEFRFGKFINKSYIAYVLILSLLLTTFYYVIKFWNIVKNLTNWSYTKQLIRLFWHYRFKINKK